jgi:alkylated DNA repair dioxygenase AlkB
MQTSLFQPQGNRLPQDGEVLLFEQFFDAPTSKQLFDTFKKTIQWKQEPIKMFGKLVMQPRLTAWYGDPDKSYRYSGITMEPLSWTAALLQVKKSIETKTDTIFNSVLLNFYRDGNDSMGWHRDNEPELGQNPVIGSVSFGATRNFQLRHYLHKEKKCSLPLSNGSLLLMQGATQHHWEHGLPKTKQAIGERINLTFRRII